MQLTVQMLLICLAFVALGCASAPEKPATKAHPATLINDLFPAYSNMPVREVKKQEFFFKCNQQTSWRPFSTNSDYSCNSPF